MNKPPVESLTIAQAQDELECLANDIAKHSTLYHRMDAPLLLDSEYDALVKRNQLLEARFPELVKDNTPSDKVGPASLLRCVKDSD